ncbi:HERV-H LTR-associating protein 2 [Bombina bombina]|uniref:HERV-H LTR-associating protein 2 n=1 Tax=Bombina bombina TaxID=8345 RepID=UPI00235A9FB3|nr:HERV-H LTR-associating protein 2 [Bombina bombina]
MSSTIKMSPEQSTFFLFLILFDAVLSETIVWGQLSKDITLPCLFTPGEDEIIYWYLADNYYVHSYYDGKDQLTSQGSRYKNRTSMFASEVNKGNASLQLQNLQMSDENKYNCYVATKKKEEFLVTLHVAEFEHLAIKYELNDMNKLLKCYVNNSSPNDSINIAWYQSNSKLKENISSHSSFKITNIADKYQCQIHHKFLSITWNGYWEMTNITLTVNVVEFECKACETLSTSFFITWTFRNESLEIPMASMNSSTKNLSISENYKHRINSIAGELYFQLKDLTKEDNGEYVCTVTTKNSMSINVTSLTVIPTDEINSFKRPRNFFATGIAFLAAAAAAIAAVLLYKVKKKGHQSQNREINT